MLPWLLLAVFDRNRGTVLGVAVVAFNLGNWMTVDVWNIKAEWLGDWTTFPGVFLLAVGSGNIPALFLLDSLTNLLRNIMAILLGNLATLLLWDVATFFTWNFMAFLLIPNLLAYLLVDGIAFLLVRSLTFIFVSCITFTLILSLK